MPKIPQVLSSGEELLALHLRAYAIPFEREYQFCESRKWRFDYKLAHRIAVEVDGGNWTGGHSRGKAHEAELRKMNHAARLGWTVYHFTTAMIESGEAIDLIREALK